MIDEAHNLIRHTTGASAQAFFESVMQSLTDANGCQYLSSDGVLREELALLREEHQKMLDDNQKAVQSIQSIESTAETLGPALASLRDCFAELATSRDSFADTFAELATKQKPHETDIEPTPDNGLGNHNSDDAMPLDKPFVLAHVSARGMASGSSKPRRPHGGKRQNKGGTSHSGTSALKKNASGQHQTT